MVLRSVQVSVGVRIYIWARIYMIFAWISFDFIWICMVLLGFPLISCTYGLWAGWYGSGTGGHRPIVKSPVRTNFPHLSAATVRRK